MVSEAAALALGVDTYGEAFAAGLRPDPPLTVAEWSDEYRYLSATAAAEPGKYLTDRTPYLREVMDCLSPSSPVSHVVFKKSAQVGGSEAGFNWLGYIIDRAPGPTLMVQPTVDLAKSISKQRITSMIEATPVLRERFAGLKQKDSDDTILEKLFPGGILKMTGANSAAGLRSMPVKNLFLDEVDAYPRDVDGEGDPIELAKKRTTTFGRRKIFEVSTPTFKSASRIESAFEDSDRRHYHVPCPLCGVLQRLVWSQMVWDTLPGGKALPATARYRCESCKSEFKEFHKTRMLASGKWVAENPGSDVAGFHINALYSPLGWCSWAQLVKEWMDAQKDPTKMRVFVNTALGETYEVKGEDAPQWKDLYARREGYPVGRIPGRVVLLTAAVDVQKNRLEATIVGWNRKEAWVIDHVQVAGDTSLPADSGPWRELDKLLLNVWPHESGATLQISLMLIDSGYNTTRVYEYVRRHSPRLVVPIKGQDSLTMPIGTPRGVDVKINGKRIKRGIRLLAVGSSVLKADLYGRLKLPHPTDEEVIQAGFPATYIHFPMLGEEYFRQLTAEQLILLTSKRGQARYAWVKTYPNNEALDCLCYNMAAYWAFGAARWADQMWVQLEEQVRAPRAPGTMAAQPQISPKPVNRPSSAPRKRRESIW